MVLKNLLRRKGRTILTVLGISVGVAAIIALGAMATGIKAGYNSVLTGSKADLVLTQPDAYDVSLSSVDEPIGDQLLAMSEVSAVSGLLMGNVQTEGSPYFFVFGYPEDSFVLSRFQITDGVGLGTHEAQTARGKPLLLGSSAADELNKEPGDTIRLAESTYRIVGIYETGDAFEENGAVMGMKDAQDLLGRPRQVSLFYIQLKDPNLRDRLETRAERLWPDLSMSSTDDYANNQMMGDMLGGFVSAIAGLAILIGGVSMMNAQLMSVMERTREIGVLRAIGWRRWRVMAMILGESILVGLLGGGVGIGLGWLALSSSGLVLAAWGATTSNIDSGLLIQAFVTVVILGLVGGMYPAWRASRLEPVEALRYEGGAVGKSQRLPVGGMAVQGLWQRKARTFLTLGVLGLTIGAIMSLDAMTRGMVGMMGNMLGENSAVMVWQAGASDTGYSQLDERIGDRIAVMPEVKSVSGLAITATFLPDAGLFVLQGYAPNEYAIRRFPIVEGEPLTGNHQILLGRTMAEGMHKEVGDSIDVSGVRFRVTGIYETGVAWEESGGVISLRDAQSFMGRPRKVTMFSVTVDNPSQAQAVTDRINADIPEAKAALSGEFAEQLPDMQATKGMVDGISVMAILVGGIGMMNTMLMTVLERTREIGVLRALGWRRRAILGLILKEGALLGSFGGLTGIILAFLISFLIGIEPSFGSILEFVWEWDVFARAIGLALILGLFGGLYPAFRATRLQPVEALRYE